LYYAFLIIASDIQLES